MRKLTLLVTLICSLLTSTDFLFAQSNALDLQVQKWNPIDLEYKSKITWRYSPTDPFEVRFTAEITGPDNIKFTLPGFYDGNDTWKIRFSPTKEGEWTIQTNSEVLELNNQQTQLLCIKNENENVHGPLLVDPENPHHFIYEDGTRWFPMGYEANWLWAMDMDKNINNLPTINRFLDKLTGYGFNFILMNSYAHDTSWRLGNTSTDDYGPPLMFPWEGSNESPDFSRFNLEYWQHFDQVIEAMYQRGIEVHLYLKVYNKLVNWPKNGSVEDDLFFRWVIARYAAYPNIQWDLAKEAHYERSLDYRLERLKFIRSTDPYNRLLTVHTDETTYDLGYYDDLVDFRSHQEQTDHLHSTVLDQLAMNSWPVFNVESSYEHGPDGPDDVTYGRGNSPEEMIIATWEIQMSGGYNAYYYAYTAWDVIKPDDTPPGYDFIKKFTDFFTNTQYWLLKSEDSLVSSGHCLANPGKEYVVFQHESQPFTLNLSGLTKSMQAVWFQPLTGKYLKAMKVGNGTVELTPPAAFGKGPVVLHIDNKSD